MANNVIVRRNPDSESPPNFDIYRMPKSEEIMVVFNTEKRGRYVTIIEDSKTGLALALRMLQFLALEDGA